jgi:hypothetical protein
LRGHVTVVLIRPSAACNATFENMVSDRALTAEWMSTSAAKSAG